MKEDKSQQTKANGEAKFFSMVIHVSTGIATGLTIILASEHPGSVLGVTLLALIILCLWLI